MATHNPQDGDWRKIAINLHAFYITPRPLASVYLLPFTQFLLGSGVALVATGALGSGLLPGTTATEHRGEGARPRRPQ